jgi:hypothetical protein
MVLLFALNPYSHSLITHPPITHPDAVTQMLSPSVPLDSVLFLSFFCSVPHISLLSSTPNTSFSSL